MPVRLAQGLLAARHFNELEHGEELALEEKRLIAQKINWAFLLFLVFDADGFFEKRRPRQIHSTEVQRR
jgi:hypothetical protein